jgi:hypothetical protein
MSSYKIDVSRKLRALSVSLDTSAGVILSLSK